MRVAKWEKSDPCIGGRHTSASWRYRISSRWPCNRRPAQLEHLVLAYGTTADLETRGSCKLVRNQLLRSTFNFASFLLLLTSLPLQEKWGRNPRTFMAIIRAGSCMGHFSLRHILYVVETMGYWYNGKSIKEIDTSTLSFNPYPYTSCVYPWIRVRDVLMRVRRYPFRMLTRTNST